MEAAQPEPQKERPTAQLEPAAIAAAGLLAAVWVWWAWKQGAYFGTVELPGTMVLCAGTIVLIIGAPLRVGLSASPWARAALFAFVGLGLWTLLSAFWSPAPDIAITDAQRVLTYALAFGLGLWLCNLAGRRMHLALAPLALAGGVIALATALTLVIGHDLVSYVETDGTLQFPLGYRNANAAFFAIAFWPLLGTTLATSLPSWLRSLTAGGATLCLSLALLSQSRGSQLGALVAMAIFLGLAPRRGPALGWLLLTAFPCALVIPHLDELYNAAAKRPGIGAVHSAGVAVLCAGGIAAILAFFAAYIAGTFDHSQARAKRADLYVTRGLIAVALIGAVGFFVAIGNPVTWVDQKVAQFNTDTKGGAAESSTRFGLSADTPRKDVWRVAIDDSLRDPIFGDGAGGFRYSFLTHRESGDQTVRDAHSVELENSSELGLPGLGLLLTGLIGAGVAITRARRLGPGAASLSAVALAAGGYWLVHSSIDWFWPYPAITAPTFALLGAACAPGLRSVDRARRGIGRRALTVGVVILAISAIPPFLSKRYVNQAFEEWRVDRQGALSDLSSAEDLYPLSIDPLMARGGIARAAGDHEAAVEAFSEAVRKRPEEWAAHYYLARLYAAKQPALAKQEISKALQLDPLEPILLNLKRELSSGTNNNGQ